MEEKEQLRQATAALEAQRPTLGDAVVNAATSSMRATLAALGPTLPAQQRKQVTVLFADLAGWTQMAEQMDPEDVQAIQ